MALDPNEIISNTVVGVVSAAGTWIIARVQWFIRKVLEAQKDLDAAFEKIRELEKHAKECKERGHGNGRTCTEVTYEAANGTGLGESGDSRRMGDSETDHPNGG